MLNCWVSVGGIFKQLLPKEESFSRALYTFDIGQNDLTSGYFANMSLHQVKLYIPDVLQQFSEIVKVSSVTYHFKCQALIIYHFAFSFTPFFLYMKNNFYTKLLSNKVLLKVTFNITKILEILMKV